jgi:hypothetical protein
MERQPLAYALNLLAAVILLEVIVCVETWRIVTGTLHQLGHELSVSARWFRLKTLPARRNLQHLCSVMLLAAVDKLQEAAVGIRLLYVDKSRHAYEFLMQQIDPPVGYPFRKT